jgi:hypothetical protein
MLFNLKALFIVAKHTHFSGFHQCKIVTLRSKFYQFARDISQPRAKYRDAMPLDFRDPFVFGVFPGALRGDGKNGEL